MITKKDITAWQPLATKIEQIGSKQLFIVTLSDSKQLIYSYKTIIGFSVDSLTVYLSNERFSRTTTTHSNIIRRNYCSYVDVDRELFESMKEAKIG